MRIFLQLQKRLLGKNIYLIVTANKIIMTPTKNMAINTPPIMYKLSFGASVTKTNKIKLMISFF